MAVGLDIFGLFFEWHVFQEGLDLKRKGLTRILVTPLVSFGITSFQPLLVGYEINDPNLLPGNIFGYIWC